ncbi:urease accessory protein UreF [Rhodospirillum sp. A1_3_36]|uniref:urease accessory protein UreF n=1 Tax=Rhodospirillum sp. A1_3_36 TaxID=3391666 RepID=UPI0039A53E80
MTMTGPWGIPMTRTDAFSCPEDGLFRLMAWLSPSFPVGAFTWSHGVEYAVEGGQVTDRASLTAWVSWILEAGAGRVDADLLREAMTAVRADDLERLLLVAEEGDALRGTHEMAQESAAQGEAFLRAIGDCWPVPGLERWRAALKGVGRPCPYPVAVGLASALHGIPVGPVLSAFLHAMGANLISAGVRLVPLGQTDGQRALASLGPVVARAARASLERPWEDLGAAAPMVDWTSIRHETQYTRLFRS